MILFGEKLNSSIPSVYEVMKSGDTNALIELCKAQEASGADYLDINTAILGEDELPCMLKIVELAQAHTSCNIMLDSPNCNVIREAVKAVNRPLIINSITLDERHELIDIAVEKNAGLVALPIDEYGLCEPRERVENAKAIADLCRNKGLPLENLYIDVVMESVAVNPMAARNAIETIKGVKCAIPEAKTTCGLSNVSFGLPKRININTAFICTAVYCGLDSAIIDVLSQKSMDALCSANVISGADEYCVEYLERFR